MVSIQLINFKHVVLIKELDYGLMCYEHLANRWFSMYVGDINICLYYLLSDVFVSSAASVW
jgi:hypothetical protein